MTTKKTWNPISRYQLYVHKKDLRMRVSHVRWWQYTQTPCVPFFSTVSQESCHHCVAQQQKTSGLGNSWLEGMFPKHRVPVFGLYSFTMIFYDHFAFWKSRTKEAPLPAYFWHINKWILWILFLFGLNGILRKPSSSWLLRKCIAWALGMILKNTKARQLHGG